MACRHAATFAALLVAPLLALGAACAAADDGAPTTAEATAAGEGTEGGSGGPASSTTTASTAPPGPPRVVLAGDSLMRELSAPLIAALAGPAEASYVAMPSVFETPTTVVEWEGRMASSPPDLVVVLVGTWEGILVQQRHLDAGFADVYAEGVRPFVDVVVGGGAQVLWLGYPALDLQEEAAQLASLDEVWSGLPSVFPGVAYLDAGEAVAPGGEFLETVPLPGGGDLRVRQGDGRHLCPEGALLMAEPVVQAVAAQLGLTANPGWQEGGWRDDPAAYEHPELCAGVLG